MRRPRILVLPGSNRTGSHNARLAGVIVKSLALAECDVTRIGLRDYPLPVYDADLESRDGQPAPALALARLFHEHDGVVLVSPEYNNSVSPLLKNAIDWISRVSRDAKGPVAPYANAVFALAAASPSHHGGIRGLNHLRAILVSLDALVIGEQLAIARAGQAFDEMDRLKDEGLRNRLDAMRGSLVEKSRLLSKRWEG